MIQRKKKECVNCGKLRYIFSKGRCRACAERDYTLQQIENRKKKGKKKKGRKQKLSNLKKDARYWFQRYVRYKSFYGNEKDVYCAYGCGTLLKQPKGCDAGHYLKAELYPDAVFDERNVHVVCKGCNIRDPLLEYRKELIKRNGEEWVESLEEEYQLNRGRYKWDRTFLEDIKKKYKNLCRDLEEELKKSKVN